MRLMRPRKDGVWRYGLTCGDLARELGYDLDEDWPLPTAAD